MKNLIEADINKPSRRNKKKVQAIWWI
jgi:hypothetical protein